MSVCLRVMLVIASILTFIYIARKLKKSQFQVADAFYWITFSFILMVIGIFPGIATFLGKIVGVKSTVNFVYLVVIFLLLVRTFLLNIRISWLEDKVKNLVEEIAIRENKNDGCYKK